MVQYSIKEVIPGSVWLASIIFTYVILTTDNVASNKKLTLFFLFCLPCDKCHNWILIHCWEAEIARIQVARLFFFNRNSEPQKFRYSENLPASPSKIKWFAPYCYNRPWPLRPWIFKRKSKPTFYWHLGSLTCPAVENDMRWNISGQRLYLAFAWFSHTWYIHAGQPIVSYFSLFLVAVVILSY